MKFKKFLFSHFFMVPQKVFSSPLIFISIQPSGMHRTGRVNIRSDIWWRSLVIILWWPSHPLSRINSLSFAINKWKSNFYAFQCYNRASVSNLSKNKLDFILLSAEHEYLFLRTYGNDCFCVNAPERFANFSI